MKKLLLPLVLLLGLTLALAGCNKGSKELSLVTGGTGGTYYPLGGELAKIISDDSDVNITSQSSGASVENMQSLQKDEADLAFTQTDIANYAVNGEMMFKDKIDKVQAIGTLYPETIQIVTLKDSGINSVKDLKGKKVSVGAAGSGTFANAEQILAAYGISMDDINAQHLAFDESTDGLQDGSIDAAFITSGAPTGAVSGLAAVKPVKILPIDQDKYEALVKKYPYYSQDVVKAGDYPGVDSDVNTVAVKAMLVVSKDLDKDTVYQITKALFDNVDKITNAKKEYISAENAVKGIGIEIHPGAKKYYDEKGIKY